jgi:hypothetical protein
VFDELRQGLSSERLPWEAISSLGHARDRFDEGLRVSKIKAQKETPKILVSYLLAKMKMPLFFTC